MLKQKVPGSWGVEKKAKIWGSPQKQLKTKSKSKPKQKKLSLKRKLSGKQKTVASCKI